MTDIEGAPPHPEHRSAGEQLHRNPWVMRASWMQGLLVLVVAAAGGATFSVPGVIFLLVLFSPIYVAYRRDRLSFPLIFACFTLVAWPWAAYVAFRRTPRVRV